MKDGTEFVAISSLRLATYLWMGDEWNSSATVVEDELVVRTPECGHWACWYGFYTSVCLQNH